MVMVFINEALNNIIHIKFKKMKTFKFYAIIATLLFTAVSCVENSGKYKSLVAERDSLATEKQALDSNYNQTLVLLNDIETGFSEINQTEKEMKLNLQGVEGPKVNRREIIAAQMAAIKKGIEQNKAKIAELQQLASKNGKANGMLSETIKRLQTQMDEKTLQIQNLQAELYKKNIQITELTTTVTQQSKSISEQSQSIAEQQKVLEQKEAAIKQQDMDINTVWYCIAPAKTLKAAKIITAGGLFQGKKVLKSEFDNSAFTQVDLRNAVSIPTNSKHVKILSQHPQNSYNLVTGEDKNITIEITNPSKFWSVSKYLVVQN